MTASADNNIFGFYASFQAGEIEQKLVKQYLWGATGLKEKLKSLKWQEFGKDLQLILFEIYVTPNSYERDSLKEIGNYRRKEKAIGIPVILDEEGFFSLNDTGRHEFFRATILKRLDLLEQKVKRNKLDLDIEKLKNEVKKILILK
jgi:hypothetical protein